MNQAYKFLYHVLNTIPVKTKRVKVWCDCLHFYRKGNSLTLICPDGKQVINPLRIPKFLHLKAAGRCSGNRVIISVIQKKGFFIEFNFWNGCNNTFEIGENCMIVMKTHIQGSNGHATIGNNTYICESTLYMYCSGKTTFHIGNNNLFSSDITFWAGEGHSIIDPVTHHVTNTGGNITIGDNNWVCMNVCFLKHAKIGSGCVVGYGSLVCNDLSSEDNCIIAGNPAHIVKRNILWSEKEPWNYNGELYR